MTVDQQKLFDEYHLFVLRVAQYYNLPAYIDRDEVVCVVNYRFVKAVLRNDGTKRGDKTYFYKNTVGAIQDYLRHMRGYCNRGGENKFGFISLDFILKNNKDGGPDVLLKDIIHDKYKLDVCNELANKQAVALLMESLNKKETQVIKDYYFLGYDGNEIGERLNVSESRVSQIKTKAINKMKKIGFGIGIN